tara:strand:- start:231 stop:680 length:450 start_codon:yes stop_codon:yes gene_type:complete
MKTIIMKNMLYNNAIVMKMGTINLPIEQLSNLTITSPMSPPMLILFYSEKQMSAMSKTALYQMLSPLPVQKPSVTFSPTQAKNIPLSLSMSPIVNVFGLNYLVTTPSLLLINPKISKMSPQTIVPPSYIFPSMTEPCFYDRYPQSNLSK